MKKFIIRLLAAFVVLFVLIQLVPYGRKHENPEVVSEPRWDSERTRELAQRACFDCHSNETVWPWYSHIAPISWLVQRDTDEGRQYLNFSDWERVREVDEIPEVIEEGEMPPFQFLMAHPEARLSAEEKQVLIQGLQATLRNR